MASTRNRNTPGNYTAEQQINHISHNYYSYESAPHYGVASETHFAGNGLVGMKTAHRNLSNNYCDVESFLFGIGSTNLVSPQPEPVPEIHVKKSLNIIDRIPIILPDTHNVPTNQRNMFLN
jgi:hypothetical protein